MDLRYYFYDSRRKQKEFAEKIGVTPHSLHMYVYKKCSPSLRIALLIHFESEGKVPLAELLTAEEFEEINKKYSILKTPEI